MTAAGIWMDGWLAVCRRAWGRVGQDAAERERAEAREPILPVPKISSAQVGGPIWVSAEAA